MLSSRVLRVAAVLDARDSDSDRRKLKLSEIYPFSTSGQLIERISHHKLTHLLSKSRARISSLMHMLSASGISLQRFQHSFHQPDINSKGRQRLGSWCYDVWPKVETAGELEQGYTNHFSCQIASLVVLSAFVCASMACMCGPLYLIAVQRAPEVGRRVRINSQAFLR